MADLAPTGTTIGSKTTRKIDAQFGEAVVENDVVYRDGATGKYKKADTDLSLAAATSVGIVLVGGALDAWGIVATDGLVILAGVAMVPGDAHYLSGTPGKIQLQADLAPGDFVSYLGGAVSATGLDLSIKNYGILLV